jgi:beta-glucosidase
VLPHDVQFPAGFAWGTASSSHQSEGNNIHNDWWDWEQQPGRILRGHRSGRGNNFYGLYDSDFALLAGLGLTHYRLSIEWSRLEPEEGRVNAAELDHYRRVLESARARGITVWVNLHHFALPRWFAAKGGFLRQENLSYWRRHVERVAAAFIALATYWHPINEANAYAAGSYLVGEMPPGGRDFAAFLQILRNTLLLYRDAYAILKAANPAVRVGTIHVMIPVFPANPQSEDDQLLARNFDALFNELPLRALREGVIVLPGSDPEPVPGLQGAADFFGANYYACGCVDHHEPSQLLPYPAGTQRLTQLGNAVHPAGLRLVLERVRDARLGVPIYVAENGIGTDDDHWRIEYIAQHLFQVGEAIAAGCDVRGYFHWTSVDNFEWSRGWAAQFGLIGFDPQTFARRPKPSAHFLGRVARRNALTRGELPERGESDH